MPNIFDTPEADREYIHIKAGRGAGKCIGYVVARILFRTQKENYWFDYQGTRYLTMDLPTYRENVHLWDLIAVQQGGNNPVLALPTSRAQQVHRILSTPYGPQIGFFEQSFYSHSNLRQLSIYDELPPEDQGTRRPRQNYSLEAEAGVPSRAFKGVITQPLFEDFQRYEAENPLILSEYLTVAAFVTDMQWGAVEMSQLLAMIAVNNNYRSRYKRMVVNIDAETAPLISFREFETQ